VTCRATLSPSNLLSSHSPISHSPSESLRALSLRGLDVESNYSTDPPSYLPSDSHTKSLTCRVPLPLTRQMPITSPIDSPRALSTLSANRPKLFHCAARHTEQRRNRERKQLVSRFAHQTKHLPSISPISLTRPEFCHLPNKFPSNDSLNNSSAVI
jgi:hypothetical protein